MKIIHVVEAWKGGVASYVEVLIKDQLARGYNIKILADSNQLATDSRDLGVEIISYESSRKPWHFRKIAITLAKKIKNLDADIVHCHSTFPGLYIRLLNHKAKVIYTPHSWSFFKQDVGSVSKFIYKVIERALEKKCEHIVCMSMEEIVAANKIGLSDKKLSLIYTGIPDLKSDDGIAVLSNSGPLKVGFFGRFDYQKGFDLLAKTAPLLNENIEMHTFGGAVRGMDKKIHEKFINHGWINHDLISQLMSSMDIIIIPSRWEGFSLTPLEAMRASKPIIISNKSSLPEVVINGFNGLILAEYSTYHLSNTLNALSREQCQRMGNNARKVFDNSFKFEDFLEKMENIYRS
ncbi:glycosyltransferase [Halomonas casei]|uniref:glycosyltransferase n=1 Tax=Halomonas casei TaxID=2742613 RepID=UPI003CF9B635